VIRQLDRAQAAALDERAVRAEAKRRAQEIRDAAEGEIDQRRQAWRAAWDAALGLGWTVHELRVQLGYARPPGRPRGAGRAAPGPAHAGADSGPVDANAGPDATGEKDQPNSRHASTSVGARARDSGDPA
jgi:hypothetical protein